MSRRAERFPTKCWKCFKIINTGDGGYVRPILGLFSSTGAFGRLPGETSPMRASVKSPLMCMSYWELLNIKKVDDRGTATE